MSNMIHIALATLVAVLATWLIFSYRHRHRRITSSIKKSTPKPPPCVPGLPVLGNALPLGKQGADFLYSCWKQYGDAFTLHAVGQKMTFLFAPQSLVYYFLAPETELSFLPAVEQWTERVFGLPPADFLPRHHLILTTTRNLVGRKGAENIHQHAATLMPLLRKGILQWLETDDSNYNVEKQQQQPSSIPWVKLELSEAIVKLVFSASVEALFGPTFLQRHGIEYLYQAFFEFEGCFELAASPIPHFFQPKFKNARRKLLQAITQSYLSGDFLDNNHHSVVGDLIQVSNMPPHAVPNMLLAVLWASQANTVPTAFWTLGFLLLPKNKSSYLKDIRASINNENNDSNESKLLDLACDSSSLLIKCCMEALRLRSASTDVRIAAKDFILNSDMLIEKGTMVMICPWITHLDPRLYEDQPEVFNPYRQGAALPTLGTSDTHTVNRDLHGVAAGVGGLAGLAFGGGKFRCPGRSFAEMELGLVVGMILDELEIELNEREKEKGSDKENGVGIDGAAGSAASPGDPHGLLPAPDVRRLVGIKVPDGPCWVRVRQRRR
jgi:24-hydroxycholesterol 7alpha-hydroxylase